MMHGDLCILTAKKYSVSRYVLFQPSDFDQFFFLGVQFVLAELEGQTFERKGRWDMFHQCLDEDKERLSRSGMERNMIDVEGAMLESKCS